jgi:hypothetical protein
MNAANERLAQHLWAHRDDLFTFLHQPGLDATTLREKLVKIGAKAVRHSKYLLFQMAEVAIPRSLFARILGRITRLCPAIASG